jgi:hypothetical protein
MSHFLLFLSRLIYIPKWGYRGIEKLSKVADRKTPHGKEIAMNKDHARLHASTIPALKAGHPSLMAVSDIVVSGADMRTHKAMPSTLQPGQDDLLQSFIVWNIETHRTSRHTLFSHWLGS